MTDRPPLIKRWHGRILRNCISYFNSLIREYDGIPCSTTLWKWWRNHLKYRRPAADYLCARTMSFSNRQKPIRISRKNTIFALNFQQRCCWSLSGMSCSRNRYVRSSSLRRFTIGDGFHTIVQPLRSLSGEFNWCCVRCSVCSIGRITIRTH